LLSGDFRHGDAILVTMNPEGEVVLERQSEPEPVEEAPAA
jgi:hypothetical protein